MAAVAGCVHAFPCTKLLSPCRPGSYTDEPVDKQMAEQVGLSWELGVGFPPMQGLSAEKSKNSPCNALLIAKEGRGEPGNLFVSEGKGPSSVEVASVWFDCSSRPCRAPLAEPSGILPAPPLTPNLLRTGSGNAVGEGWKKAYCFQDFYFQNFDILALRFALFWFGFVQFLMPGVEFEAPPTPYEVVQAHQATFPALRFLDGKGATEGWSHRALGRTLALHVADLESIPGT